jgi:hypothetical protein
MLYMVAFFTKVIFLLWKRARLISVLIVFAMPQVLTRDRKSNFSKKVPGQSRSQFLTEP